RANNVVTLRNIAGYKAEDAMRADDHGAETVATAGSLSASAPTASGVKRARASGPAASGEERGSAVREPLSPAAADGNQGAVEGVRREMTQLLGKGAPPSQQHDGALPPAGSEPVVPQDQIQSLHEEAASLIARIASLSSNAAPRAKAADQELANLK